MNKDVHIESTCSGAMCGLAAALRELRLIAESSGIHRYEIYGVVFAICVACVFAWRLPDLLRAYSELRAVRENSRREDRKVQRIVNAKRPKKS